LTVADECPRWVESRRYAVQKRTSASAFLLLKAPVPVSARFGRSGVRPLQRFSGNAAVLESGRMIEGRLADLGPNPDMPRRVDDQSIASRLTREIPAGCFP
jgi:hypothetical protein